MKASWTVGDWLNRLLEAQHTAAATTAQCPVPHMQQILHDPALLHKLCMQGLHEAYRGPVSLLEFGWTMQQMEHGGLLCMHVC